MEPGLYFPYYVTASDVVATHLTRFGKPLRYSLPFALVYWSPFLGILADDVAVVRTLQQYVVV